MFLREVLLQDGEKSLPIIGFDFAAERRIKPQNVLLSSSLLYPVHTVHLELQLVVVAGLHQGCLLDVFLFLKTHLVAGNTRESCVDTNCEVFDYEGRMV